MADGTGTPVGPLDFGLVDGFRLIDAEEILVSRVFRVERLELVDPDGHQFERHVVRHPGAVAVVPLHDDGTVTLVRQFRAAVGRTVLELPAGTCDVAGEPLEETARRELAEEAGLEAESMRRLAAVYNSPGYSDQRTTIFLATSLTPCDTGRAGVEERWMTLETIDLGQLPDLIADETLLDGTTLTGLWLARAQAPRT